MQIVFKGYYVERWVDGVLKDLRLPKRDQWTYKEWVGVFSKIDIKG